MVAGGHTKHQVGGPWVPMAPGFLLRRVNVGAFFMKSVHQHQEKIMWSHIKSMTGPYSVVILIPSRAYFVQGMAFFSRGV